MSTLPLSLLTVSTKSYSGLRLPIWVDRDFDRFRPQALEQPLADGRQTRERCYHRPVSRNPLSSALRPTFGPAKRSDKIRVFPSDCEHESRRAARGQASRVHL